MGKWAGEGRAVYQECPLQVSLGGTRTEEGSTEWVGISGDAWNEEDKEEKGDLASILSTYSVPGIASCKPHNNPQEMDNIVILISWMKKLFREVKQPAQRHPASSGQS